MKNSAIIVAKGISFEVIAKLTKESTHFPGTKQEDRTGHNTIYGYKITVKVDGRKTSFDFYGSINDKRNQKTFMEFGDLKHALYCFVSDGCSADQTFSGFCSDLGYDEDSRSAERIYKACQKSLDKFKTLCPDADIYDIVNELND